MKTKDNITTTGTKLGAALGGISFLIMGLIPGFYFGSFGALIVMKHLLGASAGPTVIGRMIVAVGSMLGIACVASVHLVVGSILGTAFGYIVKLAIDKSEARETRGAEAETHS